MPPWLVTLLTGGGIYLVLQAQISGWWQRKKVAGEGQQASGAGQKSIAEADLVDTEARIREWNEHLRLAREAKAAAEAARDSCKQNLGRSLSALELVLDSADQAMTLLDTLIRRGLELTSDDAEVVQDLRATFRTSRRELFDLRP